MQIAVYYGRESYKDLEWADLSYSFVILNYVTITSECPECPTWKYSVFGATERHQVKFIEFISLCCYENECIFSRVSTIFRRKMNNLFLELELPFCFLFDLSEKRWLLIGMQPSEDKVILICSVKFGFEHIQINEFIDNSLICLNLQTVNLFSKLLLIVWFIILEFLWNPKTY